LSFYVRRLAKNGVRLISITQELGDNPMSSMIRQIMALFDEYQSKENAKHTLRAMKENARQGFWNGALPPIGYRIAEASEQRGNRTKKTLEIDPIQAETVWTIFRDPWASNRSPRISTKPASFYKSLPLGRDRDVKSGSTQHLEWADGIEKYRQDNKREFLHARRPPSERAISTGSDAQ
jgi:hypothetical protein